MFAFATGRNNGLYLYLATALGSHVNAAANIEQANAQAVGHLPQAIKLRCVLVVDPFQGYTRSIGSKYLLREIQFLVLGGR